MNYGHVKKVVYEKRLKYFIYLLSNPVKVFKFYNNNLFYGTPSVAGYCYSRLILHFL